MKKTFFILLFLLAVSVADAGDEVVVTQKLAADATATMKKLALYISTDKCAYNPGETVGFTIKGTLPEDARVRYRHLGDVVEDVPLTTTSWTWIPPTDDFCGYLTEVYTTDGAVETIYGTIAVDVSSDWTKFPRYGYVATYDALPKIKALNQMKWLSRFHINGVQFQDWHEYHDCPLVEGHSFYGSIYTDIANRTIDYSTVDHYISAQHQLGMKSIFYNLCFGVLDGYKDRGVRDEWLLYKDRNHNQKDCHDLPDSWKSDIYLANPGNDEWIEHLGNRNDYVYSNLPFDGYQIDQLGWRGTLYDYNGNEVDLPSGYAKFINGMKQRHPEKRLVMNAVSEYGAENIASTHNVDFFYNEVWGNHDYNAYTDSEGRYENLKSVLDHNRSLDPTKQTVFAAYMDYLRDNEYFNTAGVVMTDAVIFTLGGSHLELGDDHRMLCREYFPYAGVKWHDEIEDWMTHYYDFQTAYENLLREDYEENGRVVVRSQEVSFNKWAPQVGQVTYIARKVGNKTVIHLLNFTKGGEMSSVGDDNYLLCWHDNKGEHPWPVEYNDMSLTISGVGEVGRVWVATPDNLGGAVQPIGDFSSNGTRVIFTLPSLQFWTMIVIEPESASGIETLESESKVQSGTWNLQGQKVGSGYKGIVVSDGKKIVRLSK